MSSRLNKFISDSGFCSRREADKLIESGQVKINGRQVQIGARVESDDSVEVHGQKIKAKKQKEIAYIAFNKPEGITCTTESSVRDNIVDFIKFPTKIFPIGRLDKFSQGLIFLTNDGDIVNKILRAGNFHEKEYVVTIDRPVTDEFVRKMSNGIPILDTVTQKCKVRKLGKNTFNITLTQGLNRQIRRMCEYLGCRVLGLQRTRIMNVQLGKLKLGNWRHLTKAEMDEINQSIKDSSSTEEASQIKQVKTSTRPKPSHHRKAYPERGPRQGKKKIHKGNSRSNRSNSTKRQTKKKR